MDIAKNALNALNVCGKYKLYILNFMKSDGLMRYNCTNKVQISIEPLESKSLLILKQQSNHPNRFEEQVYNLQHVSAYIQGFYSTSLLLTNHFPLGFPAVCNFLNLYSLIRTF